MGFGRRKVDAIEIEPEGIPRVQPLLVEDRQSLLVSKEGKSQMHLARSKGQRLRTPPVAEGEVDITFLGPPTDLLDQTALAAARRSKENYIKFWHDFTRCIFSVMFKTTF